MVFKVTKHGSGSPPPNAVELLGELIAGKRDDAFFKKGVGNCISARIENENGIGRTRSEETEICRLKVLEIIGEVCERTPGLKLDWYAVRPAG